MKKTIWIRLSIFVSEIAVLTLSWYVLKKITYVAEFGFLSIYVWMPLLLLLFLFSCIKSIVLFVHMFRNSTNNNDNISQ